MKITKKVWVCRDKDDIANGISFKKPYRYKCYTGQTLYKTDYYLYSTNKLKLKPGECRRATMTIEVEEPKQKNLPTPNDVLGIFNKE